MDAVTYFFSTSLIWVFIALGLFFTWFCTVRRNVLLAFVGSLVWFSCALWLWFSTGSALGLTEAWSQILVWVFVILAFVPWLLFADVEVKYQDGKRSWSEYGDKPSNTNIRDVSSEYKRELQQRLGRVRRR